MAAPDTLGPVPAPSSAREALLAELLGDIGLCIQRLDEAKQGIEQAGAQAEASAKALAAANFGLQQRQDEVTRNLQGQFASALAQAARVGAIEQSKALEPAVKAQLDSSVSKHLRRHARLICAAGFGFIVFNSVLLVAAVRWFAWTQ